MQERPMNPTPAFPSVRRSVRQTVRQTVRQIHGARANAAPPQPGHGAGRRRAIHRSVSRGVGLVDTLVALSLMMVLLGGALHAMRNLTGRHVVEATAALLETDLRHARTLALASDTSMRFEVQPTAVGGTCYVVYSGTAGGCTCSADGQAQCQSGAKAWRSSAQPARQGVRILHSGRSLLFDAGKGTVTPTATLVVTDRDGQAIHQVVNLMGRTRSCSPTGMAGLRACS
jgi:type IV fimbrial biogenesis protein FimT